MRAARTLAGLALMIGLGNVVCGQSAPYEATISVPQVEVRSGPSSKFYATGKLFQGERVQVREEKDGWLAITPPKGSFSWISSWVIERREKTAIVLAQDGAPVRVGSSLSDQEPTVEQVKVARGSMHRIVGPAQDGKWWPIEPPQQEVRYIPKDAVQTKPTVETVSNSPPADAKGGNGWATPGGSTSPTMQQAEQAQKAGQTAEAIRLYEQAGRELINTNHDLATHCQNQADFLKQGNFGSVPRGYQPGVPSQASTGGDPRFAPIPNYTVGMPPPAQPVGQGQAVGYGPRPISPLPPPQNSGLGRLRRAGFFVDGQQAYVLEDRQGRPQYYVTAAPNFNLDRYVNYVINLVGSAFYRGDLRSNYMIANGVSQVLP